MFCLGGRKAPFLMKAKVFNATLIFLLSMGAGCLSAQSAITFDENFENGRLDTAYLQGGSYRLWPVTNLHARVSGLSGQQVLFSIFDSVGFQLRSYHHMVYREEGSTQWQFFDTAYKSGTAANYYFQNLQPFSADTIYLSYWAPYTYSDLQSFLTGLQGDSSVQQWVAGTSVEGRSLYAFEITDSSYLNCYKHKVVVTARQHPIEHINGYFVEGMTNFLRSNESLAQELRKQFRFFFYPMCNPDGVFNGSGQNVLGQGLNREWADSLQLGGTPEVDSIKEDIWFKTDSAFHFGIDIHSNPGNNIPYYWWGLTNSSGVDSSLLLKAQSYVQAVATTDTSSNQATSLYQNYIQGNGVNNSKTAANWFHKSAGAIPFTFEPTSEPMGFLGDNALGTDRFRLAGASLAKGFANLGDSLSPLEVNITDLSFGGSLISVAGGLPPYTINWTSIDSTISDTTRLIVYFGGGPTHVRVTDSLGCSFEKWINVPYSSLSEQSTSFQFYPNPSKNGNFKLDIPGGLESLSLKIYDLQGRLVFESYYDFAQREEIQSTLEAGSYILRVESENISSQKIIQVLP